MAIHSKRLKRLLFRILPVLAALVVLLVSLVLVSEVQQETSAYARTYLWVLVLTLLALALLFVAIVARFVSLYRKVRAAEPGARLAARWVRNFLILSLPPVLIVYFFSALFLTRTVDNWFDVEVESALADSLELGREFLDQRTLDVRNEMREMRDEINPLGSAEDTRQFLLDQVSRSGPVELAVFDSRGGLVATANFNALADLPRLPGDYAVLQARERGEYAAAEPAADGELVIRVLQTMAQPGREDLLLQAIYPLPDSISALTRSIEQEFYRYQNVSFLRGSLKKSFLLILSLVLSMTVLLAILAAISAARRMVTPMSTLAEATQRVAAGDLTQAVETTRHDEIGFLANSFNDMTRALLAASNEAETSRATLQAQGEYLETVLGSLSSGVLTLDASENLVRVNRAAERILELPPGTLGDSNLEALARRAPHLHPLIAAIRRQQQRGRGMWQQEIPLEQDGRPLVLLVRGSALPGQAGNTAGRVVVFDDVTVLNQAQRDAAWAEVARRLAHEVKNPLPPIRLAAERLRMKLMGRLEGSDAEMLDRSATTIVDQVEALRKLVDAFSDYARDADMERAPVKLDELVRQLADLYRQGDPQLKVDLDLCEGPEGLVADGGQLRQLLHNLLRNAIEAVEAGHTPHITIRTTTFARAGKPWLKLEVTDKGPGFPAQVLQQPFEPYVTSKPGGSGLGLAICRKVVTDHDGSIEISNSPGGGARAVVCLPLASQTTPPLSST
jgi:nitrogen fixation/metabolism regulation signal transduction histidine kinase